MLNNIELQKNVITVESLALFRPSEKTLGRLSGFFGDASDAISKLLGNILTSNVSLAIDGRVLVPLMKKSDYTTLGQLKLKFPKELSVDYATAMTTMKEVSVVPESLYRDLLDPFAKWLAIVNNDPSMMESINQHISFDVNRSKHARAQMSKIAKGGQPECRYNRAIRRNSDWEMVIDNINQIAATNANVTIDDVRKKVKEIDSLLQLLIGKLNAPRFEFRPTGNFVDKLVSLTYTMAAEIEFYAEFQYLFERIVECVRDDVVFLTKQLK